MIFLGPDSPPVRPNPQPTSYSDQGDVMTVMATEKRNAATGPVRSRKRTWTARLKGMPVYWVSWATRREDGQLTPFVRVAAVLDDGRPIEIRMTPDDALELALRLGGAVDTIDKIADQTSRAARGDS